jgi:Zn finger protein HypA/HybF involved in hydrogenase expression
MAFNKKPLALACHLCGSEFGTTSIAIHIPTCEKKWLAAQEILPPHLVRRRAPRPPECPIPDSKDTVGIEQYNEEAYSIYNQESRASCPSCHRQFNPEVRTHSFFLLVGINDAHEKLWWQYIKSKKQ